MLICDPGFIERGFTVARRSTKKPTKRARNDQPSAASKAGGTAKEQGPTRAQSIVAEPGDAGDGSSSARRSFPIAEERRRLLFRPDIKRDRRYSYELAHSAEGPLLKLAGGDLKAIQPVDRGVLRSGSGCVRTRRERACRSGAGVGPLRQPRQPDSPWPIRPTRSETPAGSGVKSGQAGRSAR